MSLVLIISPKARRDIRETLVYIGQVNAQAAVNFYYTLEKYFDLLKNTPLMGQQRPDLGPHIRCCSIGKYLVIYRLQDHKLEIVRLVHGARDLIKIFRRPDRLD